METKPVFWHQGLFLQPQHFQLAEQNQQARLYPYHHYLQPHFWGVCRLQLLASSLSHRTCEIESGEFIFPAAREKRHGFRETPRRRHSETTRDY